jgi:DNA polymerase III subunit chi
MSAPEEPLPGSASAGSTPGPRVEFYVIENSEPVARLKLACRIAETAFLADQRVLVWHTDPTELKSFDDLLWTFSDRSFVPHEMLGADESQCESNVLLSTSALPSQPVDIIINLAPDVPSFMNQAPRIAEIIDGDEVRRKAGRQRFKTYRDLGLQPVSHNIKIE